MLVLKVPLLVLIGNAPPLIITLGGLVSASIRNNLILSRILPMRLRVLLSIERLGLRLAGAMLARDIPLLRLLSVGARLTRGVTLVIASRRLGPIFLIPVYTILRITSVS